MKLGVGILLVILGVAAALPVEINQLPLVDHNPDEVRVKREEKNHEISVGVSRGSNSGTSASIGYSYKFKRSLPEPQDVVPDEEENTLAVRDTDDNEDGNGNVRVRRDKNNEIDVHVSRGGGGGTQGTITYRRRFRREIPVEVAEDIDETPLVDHNPDEVRVKREEKNHEISVGVSHGSSSGTSASIGYSYKFKRSLPEPQDDRDVEV